MIAYLIGSVAAVSENRLVLDVNHIGYQIFITGRDAARMPHKGEQVKIHTYLSVREDAMQLFGFLSEEDLDIYRLLLNVNGVGPKAGLGILTAMDADSIRFAVLADDAKSIAKSPGIGTKTAQKIILELKDKLSLEDTVQQKLEKGVQDAGNSRDTSGRDEAVQALVALGYSGAEALRAIRDIEGADTMDAETLLKQALKRLI